MGILLGVRSTREPTGALVLDCPACKANVTAESYTHTEQLVMLAAIPIAPKSRTYWLNCPSCGETLRSSLPASELRDQPAAVISQHVRHRVSPVKKLLAILAIGLFFMPLLGLLLGVGALIVNYKTAGWAKKLSWIALALSVAVHLLFAVLSIVDPNPYGR